MSFAILNAMPIAYFVGVLVLMSRPTWEMTGWGLVGALQILGAVLAGFGAIGFYRLWLGVILWAPTRYYGDVQVLNTEWYPDLKPNDLNPRWCNGNLGAAGVYFAISVTPLLIARVVELLRAA